MSPKDVTFRVRNFGDSYKFVDVTVDGVSLVVTKRSEFNSIIYNQGIDGLLEILAQKRFDGPNPKLIFDAL